MGRRSDFERAQEWCQFLLSRWFCRTKSVRLQHSNQCVEIRQKKRRTSAVSISNVSNKFFIFDMELTIHTVAPFAPCCEMMCWKICTGGHGIHDCWKVIRTIMMLLGARDVGSQSTVSCSYNQLTDEWTSKNGMEKMETCLRSEHSLWFS